MLTKLQFQTLFGFKPKRRLSTSKTGKKVAKKSNKVGTRMIKGVKRTVYKGKNGGKFYKKSNGRKVYFGPAMALAKSLGVKSALQVMSAKAIEGAGYTVGYKAANVGVSMLKKAIKKNKKTVAMGRKKIVAGKKRTVYKTATGAKYYKSAKGNKVYFGDKGVRGGSHEKGFKDLKKIYKTKKAKKMHNAQKHTAGSVHAFKLKFGKKRKSRRNTRFGNGYGDLSSMMGPSPAMFASSIPSGF